MNTINTQSIIYTLTVPSVPESLPVLEGLCETFITESENVSRGIALILRLSVTEACQNALNLQAPAGRLNLVTLNFLRPYSGAIALEIQDSGSGLPIDGHCPPYPAKMIGSEVVINTLMDQEIIAQIDSPTELRLKSRELSHMAGTRSRIALTKETRPRGFGLLALCRCWQNVTFSCEPATGTTLRLENPMRTF